MLRINLQLFAQKKVLAAQRTEEIPNPRDSE